MTHPEIILRAVKELIDQKRAGEFSRMDVRDQIGIGHKEWMSGYTAIFQAMRTDQPGRAPAIGKKYTGVFKKIEHGRYKLTEYGYSLIYGDNEEVELKQHPAERLKKIEPINVETLGRMRRDLFRILDLAEGSERTDEGPAKRVSRLRSEQKIPQTIANCMHTILGGSL